MSTVSTAISAPRGSNLDSRDPMAGMDAKQRSQFLATLVRPIGLVHRAE